MLRLLILVAGLLFAGGLSVAEGDSGLGHSLGKPGYLVIESGRDSSAGFRWEDGPDPGFRSLVWDEGCLTYPDSLPPEDFARTDVGIPFSGALIGSGASGRLVFKDGVFPVSEPVILSDGRISLEISGGELEIRGAMVRYRPARIDNREFKAGLLMLAGMTVLVLVLLRRARLKAAERSGS
jgi:hypothetical protein